MSHSVQTADEKDKMHLSLPSPITTRRTRTDSTSARALQNPQEKGTVKLFCREKGHGFISSSRTGEDIFVHISDIEGEYVPLPGDEVEYRLCPIPPKYEKNQAVHVNIVHLTPEVHKNTALSAELQLAITFGKITSNSKKQKIQKKVLEECQASKNKYKTS